MAARIPLPFGPNEPNGVYVSQSFGGTFSHKGDLYYSVDFLLGFDAPVLSQGHGTVVEMVENVPDGKPASEGDSDPSMGKSQIGNFVTVQYDEGFYATYQHLKQDGVEVSVGDTVIPNDLLGHVGNTGLRTNTHLHVTYGDEKIGWQAGTIANGSLSANNNTEPVLFATPGRLRRHPGRGQVLPRRRACSGKRSNPPWRTAHRIGTSDGSINA